MTNQEREILQKYVGLQLYAQVRRMGGKYRDIDCITVYELTPRMTLKYIKEVMSCVANRAQCEEADIDYPHRVYGRPTAAILLSDYADKLDLLFGDD